MASFHKEYAAVVWPDRTKVLGVTLEPVTIGHALLLWRIGSPFMVGGPVRIGHLTLALYILSRKPCSRRRLSAWEVAASGMQRRRTRWLLKLWARQIRMFCNQKTLELAEGMIDAHIGRAFQGPTVWEPDKADGEARACHAPFLQVLILKLRSELHVQDVMSYPLSAAIWDLSARQHMEGELEWVSADQVEAIGKASHA